MINSLIKNEWIKLIKRKKILVIVLFGLVVTLLVMLGVYSTNKMQRQYSTPEIRLENMENYLERLEKDLEDEDITKEEKQNIIVEIKRVEGELKNLKYSIENEGKEDGYEKLLIDKENFEAMIKDENITDSQRAQYQLELDKINYYIDNEVERIDRIDLDAYSVLLQVLAVLSALFFPIITVFAGADMVSSEFNPATAKTLLVRPVARSKILISKYVTLITVVFSYMLICLLSAFVVGGIIWGFESGLMPHVIGQEYSFKEVISYGVETVEHTLVEGSYTIIPRWQYIGLLSILVIISNFVLATFAFLISNVIRKSAINNVVSIGSVIGGIIVLELFSTKSFTKYIFMNYFSMDRVLGGNIQIPYADPNINVIFVIGILFVSLVAMFASSMLLFTKREIG